MFINDEAGKQLKKELIECKNKITKTWHGLNPYIQTTGAQILVDPY